MTADWQTRTERAEAAVSTLTAQLDEERRTAAELRTRAEQAEQEAGTLRRNLADAQQDASANAHEAESLKASLQQAERERDEARAGTADLQRTLDAHHAKAGQLADDVLAAQAAREFAEADNAALQDVLMEIATRCETPELRLITSRKHAVEAQRAVIEAVHTVARGIYKTEHPGSALLERLRALEKVRDSADATVTAYFRPGSMADDIHRLKAAIATADSLKVKP